MTRGCHLWPVAVLLALGGILTGGTSNEAWAAGSTKPVGATPLIPTAADVYERSLNADDLYSYTGHQDITDWQTGRAVRVLVTHAAHSWRRIEYLSPDKLRGRTLLSNREQEWNYFPTANEVHHNPRSVQPPADEDVLLNYTQLRANYNLSWQPDTVEFADRKAFVLTITRKDHGTLAHKLWVDAATGLVLKREDYTEKGVLAVTTAFTDINFHPSVTASTFAVPGLKRKARVVEDHRSPESGVAVMSAAAQLGGKAYAPAKFGRFRLSRAAIVQPQSGKQTLHLQYSDGILLISVFEQARQWTKRPTRVPSSMAPINLGGQKAYQSHRGPLVTLNWDTPALNITMIGEASMQRMTELAQDFDH